MKVKTSVSLSVDLIEHLGQIINVRERSDFIETAVWRYLELQKRIERDQRDIEIINQNAERLNREALDVLAYQHLP
jgi:metal-responsive CopG/Arc/MetJ family transcriptional regulator